MLSIGNSGISCGASPTSPLFFFSPSQIPSFSSFSSSSSSLNFSPHRAVPLRVRMPLAARDRCQFGPKLRQIKRNTPHNTDDGDIDVGGNNNANDMSEIAADRTTNTARPRSSNWADFRSSRSLILGLPYCLLADRRIVTRFEIYPRKPK